MTVAWSKSMFQCDLFPGYQDQLHPDQKNPQLSGSVLRCLLSREDAIINNLTGNSSYNYTEKSSNYLFEDIIGLKIMVIF